jgi:hypothetical protein
MNEQTGTVRLTHDLAKFTDNLAWRPGVNYVGAAIIREGEAPAQRLLEVERVKIDGTKGANRHAVLGHYDATLITQLGKFIGKTTYMRSAVGIEVVI